MTETFTNTDLNNDVNEYRFLNNINVGHFLNGVENKYYPHKGSSLTKDWRKFFEKNGYANDTTV